MSAFSRVYYLNLHCEDAVRDERLAARHWPAQLIDDHRKFARWLLENANTAFDPPMETIDTGTNSPEVVAAVIQQWVLARMVGLDGAEGQACVMEAVNQA